LFFSEDIFAAAFVFFPSDSNAPVKANGLAERRKKTSGHLVALSTSVNGFVLFLFLLSVMSAVPVVGQEKLFLQTFNGPDRTITWKPWHRTPEGAYRFRTGDRYLGHRTWEHYLAFEGPQSIAKAIKVYMVHLADNEVREEVVIHPGRRYAIFKVTNDAMTAHKGTWSWTAQEVD
jgi:hypothetical protein